MPIISAGDGSALQNHQISGSRYGYSGTRIQDLGASEYTLASIAADTSGSVDSFRCEIEACMAQVVRACRQSPRADNLMLRVTRFDHRLDEVHGFKPLTECYEADYDGCLKSGGTTALYDAADNAISALTRYGQLLTAHNFEVNAIVFVLTDGLDNASTMTARNVHSAMKKALRGEHLTSLISVLVGVNVQDSEVASELADFSRQAGFSQFIELAHANESTLARLADFVSQSISLQSCALASGQRSSTRLVF